MEEAGHAGLFARGVRQKPYLASRREHTGAGRSLRIYSSAGGDCLFSIGWGLTHSLSKLACLKRIRKSGKGEGSVPHTIVSYGNAARPSQ